jgi:hypothetical protein
MDQANKAFATVRECRHHFALMKLRRVNQTHATAVKKRLDVVRRAADNEDNRAELKMLVAVAGALARLQSQVEASIGVSAKR